MLTINKQLEKVRILAEGFNQKVTPEEEILGLHESATKLWIAMLRKRDDKNELGKRLASTLIATLAIANVLGIQDIERHFQKRIEEIEQNLREGVSLGD